MKRLFREIHLRIGLDSSSNGERSRILPPSTSSDSNGTIFGVDHPNAYTNFAETNLAGPAVFSPLSSADLHCQSAMNGTQYPIPEERKTLNVHSSGGQLSPEQEIVIKRPPIDNAGVNHRFGLVPSDSLYDKVSNNLIYHCSCGFGCILSLLTSFFPVFNWLPKYKLNMLLPDIIAGLTVAILHIPQGMAYGTLAGVKAENGLYVSFFPVLIYFIFGTSRHISIGTFAVISLMTSSALVKLGATPVPHYGSNETHSATTNTSVPDNSISSLEAATSLALAVGLWQLFMGVFRLGILSVVLSDQLISGFTTGAAFHVATSQIPDLFGLTISRYSGPLNLIYRYRDIFSQLGLTNSATVIVSAISIFTLAFVKEQINDRFKTRLKMPVPIDMIVVVIATVVSYLLNLHGNYQIKIVGPIPTGIPPMTLPKFELLPRLIADSFALAIVIFVISLSMAKLFAKKHHYSINANQELIALGSANFISSFFNCYPASASLARSLVQERSGGRTQMTSIFSCAILLLVLLVLAPLFFSLPKCILSCVILVALKGMFLQICDFANVWKISKIDGMIWLVTLLSTILLDISYGLMVGVGFSIFTVIARTVIPSKAFLGCVNGSDLYLDINRYNKVKEIDGVRIFRFESSLYFMNKELFKASLLKNIPIEKSDTDSSKTSCRDQIHHIIIDCSSFAYVDVSGLETLIEIMKEYKTVGITVFLSGCSVALTSIMERANFFQQVPYPYCAFPTIHDAVQYSSI